MKPVLSVTKAAFIIMLLSLGSNVLGFLREILIASRFGAGVESDAYYVSFTATTLLMSLVSTAIATTFMPLLFEVENTEGKEGKIRHVNNMLNLLFLISIILMIIGYAFTPQIIKLLASGFYDEQIQLAVRLTRIGLPKLLFLGTGVLTAFLQSERRQVSTASLGIVSNFIIITFLLFPAGEWNVEGLAYAAVIAFACQGIIQYLVSTRIQYRYAATLQLKDPYLKKTLMISIPVFISMAVNDLNTLIDRTLASSLESGSISALNYSSKLNGLILAVFTGAIVTALFPLLSKDAGSKNIHEFKGVMDKGIRSLLLLTIPSTVALAVLAEPVVKAAFMRGEFNAQDSAMTSGALFFYALGLVPVSMRLLLEKAFFSLHDTKTPMINGAMAVGFNITLNLVLIRFMAHCGLALATSLSATISTLLLMQSLRRKIGSFNIKSMLAGAIKSCIASAVMVVAALVVYHAASRVSGNVPATPALALLAAAVTGIPVYIGMCCLLGVQEVQVLAEKIKGRCILCKSRR